MKTMAESRIQSTLGKAKLIVLHLPPGGWEKLDALHVAMSEKIPGITHDQIVSTWAAEMLNRTPIPETPGATVDTERKKLNESPS